MKVNFVSSSILSSTCTFEFHHIFFPAYFSHFEIFYIRYWCIHSLVFITCYCCWRVSWIAFFARNSLACKRLRVRVCVYMLFAFFILRLRMWVKVQMCIWLNACDMYCQNQRGNSIKGCSIRSSLLFCESELFWWIWCACDLGILFFQAI